MPSTFASNRSTYVTLSETTRAAAAAKTDSALSGPEQSALADTAHELRILGFDLLSFAIGAVAQPRSAAHNAQTAFVGDSR